MKTYEDLLACGEDDKARGEFVRTAVQAHETSQGYKDALVADQYYRKRNVTIEQYEKFLYTITGRKVKDIYSANHRLKTQYFRRMVVQQANYLLGRGVKLEEYGMKERLGKDFDYQMIRLAKIAMVEGKSYGYWNYDHLEVFAQTCTDLHPGFCPIYSEQTGELEAGVRFWNKRVGDKVLKYFTLFEPEGKTEFVLRPSEEIQVLRPREGYTVTTVTTEAEGLVDAYEENYGRLPIIPLYASDTMESELNGIRESIDCYDLVKSGLANTIDDASEIYWIVKNAGGMDDVSLAQFLTRLKTSHAATVDAESGGGAEAHTLDIPYEARKAMLELLRSDLYEDMMLLDMKSLSAGQKTTQELQSAYQPMDDKTNDFEFYVLEFLDGLFEIVGIDSDVSLVRNKVVNVTEQTNMVLSASNYLSAECVIRHLPWLTPEEQEEEIKRFQDEQVERYSMTNRNEPEEDEEEGEEDAED